MIRYYLMLSRLLGISVSFLHGIVARDAIVGGHTALYPTISYHATVLIPNRALSCGGGVIGEHAILTAAHCVINRYGELIDENKISVLVATIDLEVAGVVVQVERIAVPMEYKSWDKHSNGDIAVLMLKRPLEIEKHHVKILILPSHRRTLSHENKTAKIAGFGWDEVFKNNLLIGDNTDHKLRYIDTRVLSDQQCQHDHPSIINSEKQFCAKAQQDKEGTRRRGVCVGDDGGTLVRLGKFVIGVLSVTTIGCSEKTSSGIYTRVSYYREFIHNAIHNRMNESMRVIYV